MHPETLDAMGSLGFTLMKAKKYTEADKELRNVIDTQRKVLGPDHPEIAKTDYNLACVRAAVGDREEALKLLHQAVDHGLDNLDMTIMGIDPDLNGLHGDPRFSELVTQAKSRAAASGAK